VSDAKEDAGTIKYPGTVKIYDNITIGTVYNGMVVNNGDIADFSGNTCLATEEQWTYLASNTGPASDGMGHKLPGPAKPEARFQNSTVSRLNPTQYGSAMQANGNAELVDMGGNVEYPCLTQEQANILYKDFEDVFVANGSWAVGFYDKYKAKINQRLGEWYGSSTS
jgi:hypothetical protein